MLAAVLSLRIECIRTNCCLYAALPYTFLSKYLFVNDVQDGRCDVISVYTEISSKHLVNKAKLVQNCY